MREEERSSQPWVEGLGGCVERDVADVGSTGVGIVEAEVEDDGAMKELEISAGGGMRWIDG